MADVLDDDESGEALAGAVDEVLVDAAGVDSDALLHDGVVLIAIFAFAALSVDWHVARQAVAVEGVGVEHLVVAASVALGLVTILNLDCGFAEEAGLIAVHRYPKE